LPAPCVASSYSQALEIAGGTPPYDWQLTPPVEGWALQPDPAAIDGGRVFLVGEPAEVANVTVQATDSAGLGARVSYDLRPRGSCWFAYVALQNSGPALELLDPVLEAPPPVALAHNSGVYDFAFSPDGRFLAYRFGQDAANPRRGHLALLDLSTWDERALNFSEDAVTAYSWSSDSRTLAVAFERTQVSYLGAVRVAMTGSAGSIAYLEPTPAFVQSNLHWIGGAFLAFDAALLPNPVHPGQFLPNPLNQRTAYYTELEEEGFREPVPINDFNYDPPLFVQPTADGFFALSAISAPYSVFNSLSSEPPSTALHLDNFIAPSGRFTAALSADELRVFNAADGALGDPFAKGQGCPKLLAWAKGRERIACVADVLGANEKHGEIRIFDVLDNGELATSPVQGYCMRSTNSVAAPGPCAGLEYDYTEAQAELQPRAFSATGRWFAFTTSTPDIADGNYLYWADLGSQPMRLKRKDHIAVSPTMATTPVELQFSPNERYLLQQRGSLLSAHGVTVDSSNEMGAAPLLITNHLQVDSTHPGGPCSADFASAPERWCGNADRKRPFVWSPNSLYAAYRVEGKLGIVEFSRFPELRGHAFAARGCDEKCSGQFAFQPGP
jgi:hypothetical protein